MTSRSFGLATMTSCGFGLACRKDRGGDAGESGRRDICQSLFSWRLSRRLSYCSSSGVSVLGDPTGSYVNRLMIMLPAKTRGITQAGTRDLSYKPTHRNKPTSRICMALLSRRGASHKSVAVWLPPEVIRVGKHRFQRINFGAESKSSNKSGKSEGSKSKGSIKRGNKVRNSQDVVAVALSRRNNSPSNGCFKSAVSFREDDEQQEWEVGGVEVGGVEVVARSRWARSRWLEVGGLESVGSKSVGSKSVGSKSVGSKSVGLEVGRLKAW